MFGTEKLEWCGYAMVKKSENMFTGFNRIHERDRRTERPTDTTSRHAALMHSIARQKLRRKRLCPDIPKITAKWHA